ncbi:MAG TPA: glycosyltransferase, partial [Bryobacteraceae bacterium]|nr:glycosyltransferase [Bryobacteraceae bacterium]
MIWIAILAGAYQLFAILVCALARGQRAEGRGRAQSVSILKPIRGAEPGLREALRSHSDLDGDYELLCGVADPEDPALAIIREFPKARAIVSPIKTANAKVGVLMGLAAEAKHPILIVNDADVRVERDYLTRVTAPLADPRVGVVTCLFRPLGSTFAARFEGLGVSTDFAPAALIARQVGVDEFAIGATMAFRRSELDRIGGFASIADYVADDYQLGMRIHRLGFKCVLSDVVVESGLGGHWREVWAHQVRWARTIRVSKTLGYL